MAGGGAEKRERLGLLLLRDVGQVAGTFFLPTSMEIERTLL